MGYRSTLLIIFLGCFNFAVSQSLIKNKIAEDRIDEFTKNHITRTSWNALTRASFNLTKGNLNTFTRLEKIDSNYYLNLKVMTGAGSVIAMRDEANLMIMTTIDSIITLKNEKYQISCRGCGAIGLSGSEAHGLDLDFQINSNEMDFIKKNGIKKIRIYLTEGYMESEVKEKFSNSLSEQLQLITSVQ